MLVNYKCDLQYLRHHFVLPFPRDSAIVILFIVYALSCYCLLQRLALQD